VSLAHSLLLQGIVTGLFVGNFVVDRMQVLMLKPLKL
jgi:hypothetical protein